MREKALRKLESRFMDETFMEIISYQGALIRYIINSNGFKFTSEFSNLPKSKNYKEGGINPEIKNHEIIYHEIRNFKNLIFEIS